MKVSINYALSTGSDISPEVRSKVLETLWQQMEFEGRVLRSKIETQLDILGVESVALIDGLDYALVGVADYPHDCVIYDYVRCVEIFATRDKMTMVDASEEVEKIIAANDVEDEGPIFLYPLDYINEDELDDYDLLNAHEVVFDRTNN